MRISRLIAAAVALISTPAFADVETKASEGPQCDNGECTIRLTGEQLLARAEQLVSEHRFEEAAPMLAALENAPQLALERDFLLGYSAVEKGELDQGIKLFRRVLSKNPEQTRVRLELGRALMLKGKMLNADYHFRLAQQDQAMPKDVVDFVRTARANIRSQQRFSMSTDFGVAPDSNITNGTNAQTVDVNLGPLTVPLTLDANARKKSGTGQFATMNMEFRTSLAGETRLLVDAESNFTNYKGKSQDDGGVQLAVGPEFDLGTDTTMAVQAVGAQRFYGGKSALRGFGMRTTLQHNLDEGQRIGFSIDARRNVNQISSAYSGWQFGGYASYERVFARSLIGSATLFGRRDALNSKPYASFEIGGALAIGGELPRGITAGVSVGMSRAIYDKPLAFLSAKPRSDWRLNGRVSLGLRSMRVLGFSPSISYSYSKTKSNIALHQMDRSRFRFALARYF